MWIRLEKINHRKRQKRYYTLSIGQDLFGAWELTREWGRIGAHGGQAMTERFDTEMQVASAWARLKRTKHRRGYASIPVQLELF